MLDLVKISEDQFSDVAAHIYHDSLKCSSHSIKNNTILSKCLENICLQNQRIKYQKHVSKKKQNYCLKSSQNARNRTVCLKIFRWGILPDPPRMALRLRHSHSRVQCLISAAPTKNRWLRLCKCHFQNRFLQHTYLYQVNVDEQYHTWPGITVI